ncbi:MAG: amidohydrolase family protein [Candidatus Latescibacterota bacterium]|jgi:predicted TIM-barrel fold metal-dependent hydrolase
MDKVDVHVHVFDRLSDQFPRGVSTLAPAERTATAEQLLREMDAAGIARAVLIDMGGTRLEEHRYVTSCIRRWPDRFVATGLVDVNDPDPPARLRELVAATGIKGIRLGNLGDPAATSANELLAYGLFEVASELGLNINVYASGGQVGNLALLAAAFPKVTISLDHLGVCPTTASSVDRWGRPRFDDEPLPPVTYPRMLDLARFPNVVVKISGEYAFSKVPCPYGDMKPMVERVYRAFGPGRMMWCSDFPWIVVEPGYGRLAALLDQHLPDIPAAEREQIMGGNGLRVWFDE